jgi:hypothetical protein
MDVPDLAEILEKIPTPSAWNTLPFQLPKWIYTSIVGIPSTIRSIHRILEERKQRKKQEEEALLVFRKHAQFLPLFLLMQFYIIATLTEKLLFHTSIFPVHFTLQQCQFSQFYSESTYFS